MPANLSEFEEKVIKYLFNRKTAATVKQIAKFFIRSESYINSTLRGLVEKNLIDTVQTGSTKLYIYKE